MGSKRVMRSPPRHGALMRKFKKVQDTWLSSPPLQRLKIARLVQNYPLITQHPGGANSNLCGLIYILQRVTDIENMVSNTLGNTDISKSCHYYKPTTAQLAPIGFEQKDSHVYPKWNPFDVGMISSVYSCLQSNDVGHQSIDTNTFLIRSRTVELHDIISSCHTTRKNYNICVQGVPGTGKTFSLKWIQKQTQAREDVIFSYVNAYRVSRDKNVTCEKGDCNIFKKLAKNISQLQNVRLRDIVSNTNRTKMYVLVIDEIDHLSDSELMDFYIMCGLNNAWCVCIGISNILNFTDSNRISRLTPMGIAPKRISFNAFDSNEILNILKLRLAKIPYSVFSDASLAHISRIVAKRSGDVRMALKLADEAVHNCVQRLQNDEIDTLVNCIDVSKSAHTQKAHNLSIPQAMMLRTFFKSSKRQFEKSQLFCLMLAYNKEKDEYKRWRCLKKCNVLEINCESELLSLCDSLVCLGYFQEKCIRKNTYIRLSISDADIEQILRQKKIL